MHNLIHLSILFYVLFNSPGSLPAFITLLKDFKPKEQRLIIVREMVLALIVSFIFIFNGLAFFKLFDISLHSFKIGGGLMLFLISLKMCLAEPENATHQVSKTKEPVFFPLAFPIITGPAVLTNLLVFMSDKVYEKSIVLLAILISWFFSLLTLLCASLFNKILGKYGLIALERIFSLFLLLISGNLMIKGFIAAFST